MPVLKPMKLVHRIDRIQFRVQPTQHTHHTPDTQCLHVLRSVDYVYEHNLNRMGDMTFKIHPANANESKVEEKNGKKCDSG